MYGLALAIVMSINVPENVGYDWSFGVIGDTQRLDKTILERMVRKSRKYSLDFVVHLGDMDNCGHGIFWRRSKKIIQKSKLKWYYVIGNHELYTCGSLIDPTRKYWIDFWRGKGYTSTFVKFSHKGLNFLILDTATYFVPIQTIKLTDIHLSIAEPSSTFLFFHRPLPYPRNFKLKYRLDLNYYLWYSELGGVKYVKGNKLLWHIVKSKKNRILGCFHGHHHAFRPYALDGIPVFDSGGGGATLETKWDFYHFLVVAIKGKQYKIIVVKL